MLRITLLCTAFATTRFLKPLTEKSFTWHQGGVRHDERMRRQQAAQRADRELEHVHAAVDVEAELAAGPGDCFPQLLPRPNHLVQGSHRA